jgi:hypothetical protein
MLPPCHPPFPPQVQEACSSWLSSVSSSCKTHGLGLLQQCPDAPSLLQAEAAVHTAIAEWLSTQTAPPSQQDGPHHQPQSQPQSQTVAGGSRPATAGSGGSSTGEDAGRRSRLQRLAPAVAAAAARLGMAASPPGSPSKGGRGRGAVSEWDVTCLAVVGGKVDLWQVRGVPCGREGPCVVGCFC